MVGESSMRIGGDEDSCRTTPGVLENELPAAPVLNGLKPEMSSGVEADEDVVAVVTGIPPGGPTEGGAGLSVSVAGIALFTASYLRKKIIVSEYYLYNFVLLDYQTCDNSVII